VGSFVSVVAFVNVCTCKCAPVSTGGVDELGFAVLFAAFF
jgi:hypothetical protein